MVKSVIRTGIFIFSLLLLNAAAEVTVLKETSSSILMEVSFDTPRIIDEADGSYIYIKGLSFLQEENTPFVPYATYLFSLPGREAAIKIINKKEKTYPITHYYINSSKNKQPLKQKEIVQVNFQGILRGISLFSLTIFPVRINVVPGMATVIETITLEVRGKVTQTGNTVLAKRAGIMEKKLFDNLLLNKNHYMNGQSLLSVTTDEIQPYRPDRIKLIVEETGIYQVTYQDLMDAEINPALFDTRKLRLLNRGKEIPIFFKGGADGRFDTGDYFEFWGEQNLAEGKYNTPELYFDPFSDKNVYWLEVSDKNGIRLVEENGALIETNPAQYITPYAFTETIHFEADNYFEHFGQPSANLDLPCYFMDHWYFDKGITAQSKRNYRADLPHPLESGENSVYATVYLRGKSYRSTSNPLQTHQVDVWLNDEKIGSSGQWPDQAMHVITNKGNLSGSSQANLRNGENELNLIMNQQNVYDVVLLNWFEITYQRKYRADQNYIQFKKQEGLPENYIIQFEVDGFTRSNIEIYKLGVSKIVAGRIDYPDQDTYQGYRLSFQDQIYAGSTEYVALTSNKKLKPLLIEKDMPWKNENELASLLNTANAADYLIITNELFYENCLQLKTHREQSGLKVEVVKVADIYDEFNYGIKSPLAIKRFLNYAYYNWNQNWPLLYVTLVGDALRQYKAETDYVPTILYETYLYGAAASDHQYALLDDNDDIPDLIVGRIPVASNSELLAYLEKLKGFETETEWGPWRNTALFISGNDASTYEIGSNKPAFRAQNQRIIDLKLPEGMFVRKLNTVEDKTLAGRDPNFGSTTDLINYFDEGVALVNFFGHGGGGIWADVQLLNLNDIDRLNNQFRLPFVKSMTCFTGAFEGGSRKGLLEKMVVMEEKGVIGTFACSGLGWLHNDFAIGWTLTDFLLDEDLTAGEAVLFTKLFYMSNNLYILEDRNYPIPDYFRLKNSMVNHYNFLGDPYVTISIPKKDLIVDVDNSVPAPGDTVTITVKAPFSGGNGKLEITSQAHDRLQEEFIAFNNSDYQTDFIIPDEVNQQNVIVKAYATNDAQDARGVAWLAINKVLLDSIRFLPARPMVYDTIHIHLFITAPQEIRRVFIENLKGSNGRLYSYELEPKTQNHWVTSEPVGPYNQAGQISFTIAVEQVSGEKIYFNNNILEVFDTRLDLVLKPHSLSFEGDLQIGLSCIINVENSNQTIDSEIYLYADHYQSAVEPLIKRDIELLPGQSHTKMHIPLPFEAVYRGRNFVVKLDPHNRFTESNESNNSDSLIVPDAIYNVPYEVGTTNDGVTNDTIAIGLYGKLYIPPKGLSASSVLNIKRVDDTSLRSLKEQPGFHFIPFVNAGGDSSWFCLEMQNTTAHIIKDIHLEIPIDTTNYDPAILDNIAICRYAEKIQRWKKTVVIRKGNLLRVQVAEWGHFALFYIDDHVNPVIEITADGRNMYDKIYIARQPRLAFILQDENGIDISESGFQVFLDEKPLTSDAMHIPDTAQNANTISILTTPQISEGSHTLRAQVLDVNGNRATKSVIFNVTEAFDIEIFGNYPNPFNEETTISYENRGQPLTEFKIKIYTISGRLIREITSFEGDDLRAPGYHEVVWYGRDDDGNLVANGVYFTVVKAVSDRGELKEKILKIAKLR
jgi:hypothetical protein